MRSWGARGWKRKRGGVRNQGLGTSFAALPQVLDAGCWMVKERHRPSTPGASNPTGKTDGGEVIVRLMPSANEKYRVFWEPLLGWEVGRQT